ncbi:MAG: hypothetical protein R3E94_12460 [Burkholderiaceae bacterium]
MSEHVDGNFRQLDGVWGYDQFKRTFAAVGKPLGQRGDQVGALQDVTYRDEMRHHQSNATGHTTLRLILSVGAKIY